jgi:hypothetical protein
LRRMLRRQIFTFLFCLGTTLVSAQQPALDHLFPAGAAPDTTNSITLFGKFEPWPPKFWSDSDQITFNPTTNKAKVEFRIAPGAKPGAHLVRIYNDDGASDPRIFVIGSTNEISETEPNDLFSRPEAVKSLPLTINGRFEKRGDVDSFALDLKAGQWLDAKVDSFTLQSKLDAVLRLLDTAGYELAMNHDWATFDPRLIWRSPTDQKVVLQIFGFAYPANSEIQLSGGEGAIYRLNLSAASQLPADLCERPTEKEPNDTIAQANPIDPDATVVGLINNGPDEDRFQFKATKDTSYEFEVEAISLGSPLDSWLRIEDSAHKELAHSDDVPGSRDPRLEWKAPADTNYFVALGSVTHRGGEEYRYHLQMRKLEPDYKANLTASSFAISPGGTNELKLNLKRLRGFTNELVATLTNIPEGVKAEPLTLPQKDGEAILKLVAATNAPPHNGPFHLTISDQNTKKERSIAFELTGRSEDNGVPGGYSTLLVESTDDLWLTVLKPKAAEPKAAEPKEKK